MAAQTVTLTTTPVQISGPLGGGQVRTMTITTAGTNIIYVGSSSAALGADATRYTIAAAAGTFSFDVGPNESVWAVSAAATCVVSVWFPAA